MKFGIGHHPLGNPHTPGVTNSTEALSLPAAGFVSQTSATPGRIQEMPLKRLTDVRSFFTP
jgi:hypothetical protein